MRARTPARRRAAALACDVREHNFADERLHATEKNRADTAHEFPDQFFVDLLRDVDSCAPA